MIEKPEKKIIEHANGGKGHLILEPIAGPDILKDKCRLYVKATLEKGCSVRSTTFSQAKASTPTTIPPTK